MAQGHEEHIELVGSARTIEYAVLPSGDMPARSFVRELDDADKRKVVVLFRRMAEIGQIHNKEQFKKVQGSIFEFKRFQIRIGCFQTGRRWILTHGFIKKRGRWPRAELARAERIMSEHVNK